MVMLVYLSFLLLLYTRLLKAEAAGSAETTRSWNCCKHSCSWPGAGNVSHPVKTCDRNNTVLPLANYANSSSCDGGGAYACADLQPWRTNDTTLYGFAAVQLLGETEKAWCCACYNLIFTSGILQNHKMVVQAVSTTGGNSSTFDLQIPAGSLGGKSSCAKQYNNPEAVWGSPSLGVSSGADCSSLPPALQAGCRWRFDWFRGADNPSVNFTQVPCPAALTEKSNCSRVDEMLQLAQVTTEPSPLPSPLGPLSPPPPPSISNNVKIIVAVCVPLVFITSILAAYWLFRRQKTNLDRIPKRDVPGVSVYIQDLGIDHLHKRNAITIHELEMSPETEVPGSRRWTILKYTKPLPNIPVELKGSSVCKELEGNWEGPWM